MLNRENSPADLAIRSLRAKVLLDEVPKTDIAKSTGIKRTTLGYRLKQKDISINEFLVITDYLKIDPFTLLRESLEQSKKIESATNEDTNSTAALSIDNK